jgi:polar amino acid transport system substrate-binding protein
MLSISFILKKKLKNLPAKTYPISVFLLVLALFTGLLKGCNHSNSAPYYRIAHNQSWTPFDLMGKEKNVTTFTDELLLAIAQEEKMQVNISIVNQANLIPLLENKQFDGVLTTLKPRPYNEVNLIFSDPYFLVGPVLILPVRSTLAGWQKATHRMIGIHSKSVTILEADKDPSIQLRLYDNILRALADLDNNHIDGVIFPAIQALTYTNTFYQGRARVATTPLTNEGLRLVALKNAKGEDLIKKFNQGLKDLKDKGTYDQLMEKWGFSNPEKINEPG